jgi:hypothetical protein
MLDVMKLKAYIGVTAIAALAALTPATAPAKMQSVDLGGKVCQTTGGGKFVDIPGFPGEKVDRRLLQDIKFLRRKYHIFITDAYSNDPIHAGNGEHPIGLALDIVPNTAEGGDWNDIDRLANWAEPHQNQPRSPFRWVGYNGDSGHGRGNHLHLSYSHSETRAGTPADMIYSVKCPRSHGGDGTNSGDGGGGGTGGGIGTRSAGPFELAPIHPEAGGIDG